MMNTIQQTNNAENLTLTCPSCKTESTFTPGQLKCPSCSKKITDETIHCRNCGEDFSALDSPLCPSCGLHMQDVFCKNCGIDYRFPLIDSPYPCPDCGQNNEKYDFLLPDIPMISLETEYATYDPPTLFPFDERTSPVLLNLLPSTNLPFRRNMPFSRRENTVNLEAIFGATGTSYNSFYCLYKIDTVRLTCDTESLPEGAGIRLKIKDRRSYLELEKYIIPERKKQCKCFFSFDSEEAFHSRDLTFMLTVEREGKILPMDIPVVRAYTSRWIQWRDSDACLFTPALCIYGIAYDPDPRGTPYQSCTTFPYESEDVTDYPGNFPEPPELTHEVLCELPLDEETSWVHTIDSKTSLHHISLDQYLPTGYPTELTGITFICDTLERHEGAVMRLVVSNTFFPPIDVSIIPPRSKQALCKFFFEPLEMNWEEFYVSLTYEWAGNVQPANIRMRPSSKHPSWAQWKDKDGLYFTPAMTLFGHVYNPVKGEKYPLPDDLPTYKPNYPTEYPETEYPTTNYPTTNYPTEAYRMELPDMGTRAFSAKNSCEAPSSKGFLYSSEDFSPSTAYLPASDYPPGNFDYLDDEFKEVTCYNSGDPNHGILDFNFDFGAVKTEPAQPPGQLSLKSQTLDSLFSSPEGLKYRYPTQRHIGAFNSSTGLLKDARQVCVITESGNPRFTDFTKDPEGEQTDRSRLSPEFLKKITVKTEDGSGILPGTECFEETLEDGTVLRYSMETGAVIAIKTDNSSWTSMEDTKNDLRVIYQNPDGSLTDSPLEEVYDNIDSASPARSAVLRQIWSRRDGLLDIKVLTDTSYKISWYSLSQVINPDTQTGLFNVASGVVPLKAWTMEAIPIAYREDTSGKKYELGTDKLLTEEDLSYLKGFRITERRGELCFVQQWEQPDLNTLIYTQGEGAEKEVYITTQTATAPVSEEEINSHQYLDNSYLKVGDIYTHEIEQKTVAEGLPGGFRTIHRRYPFGDVILLQEKGVNSHTVERITYEYELDPESPNYGCCTSENHSNGKVIEYKYDKKNRLISQTEEWAGGHPMVTRFTYANLRLNDKRITSKTKIIRDKIISRTQYSFEESPALIWQKISKTRRGSPISHDYSDQNNLGLPLPEVTLTEFYGKDPALNGASSPLAAGRMKRVVSPDGVESCFTYQEGTEPGVAYTSTMTQMVNGEIIPNLSIRKVSFYNTQGQVVREQEYVHTGQGFTLTDEQNYTYDASRRVCNTRHANGRETSSIWICVGPLEETDENGRKTRYEYNSAKRLKRMIQEALPFIPDENDSLNPTPIPQKITEYKYDGAGRQKEETIIQGEKRTTRTFERDALGRTISEIDAGGRIKRYQYSSDGLETTVFTPEGATYTWRYHQDGNLLSETGTGQESRYYRYNVHNYGLETSVYLNKPDGILVESTLTDGLERVLIQKKASGQTMVETETRYSDKGKPSYRRTKGDPHVSMEYDSLGNMNLQYVSAYNVSLTLRTDRSYLYQVPPEILPSAPDSLKQPLVWKKTTESIPASYSNPLPVVTETWELVSRILPEISQALLKKDKKGRYTMSWQSGVKGKQYQYSAIPESNVNNYSLSWEEKPLKVVKREGGNLTYNYTFLSSGERCQITDARGNTITSETDLLGRTLSQTTAEGLTVTMEYDAQTGLLMKTTNPEGKTTQYSYDDSGNLKATFGTAVQPMCYQYDKAGRLLSLRTFRIPGEVLTTSPENRTDGDLTQWSYEAASGDLISKTMPDGQKYYWYYNNNGKQGEQALPGGKRISYEYAYLSGWLSSIHFNDNTPPVQISYNAKGQIDQIADASGIHSFDYDNYFDTEKEKMFGLYSSEIRYNWDTAGRSMGHQLHINNALCQKVDYEYKNDQRINRLVLDNDGAYQYFWNTDTGLPEKMIWPDGVSRELSYENQRNLVNNLVYKTSSGASLLNLEKSFDSLSRLTYERNSQSSKGQRAFVYNSRGEIISDTQERGETRTYTYDNIGNFLTSRQNQSESRNYLSNLLNQYTSVTENTPSQTRIFVPEYDETGNQTQIRTETGDWQVDYNAENRPITFTKGTEHIDCLYDYMGRRTRKNHYKNDILVSSTLYIYKGYQLIAELDGMAKKTDQQLTKTWLWDPTGQFNNSPLEMLVWNEDLTAYPTTDYPTTDYPTTDYPTTDYPTTDYPTTDYPTTDYPTTDYPTTEYPTTEYPSISFFSTADLLMRDLNTASSLTTVISDHILLSLKKTLSQNQCICVDRIATVLHLSPSERYTYHYKAIVYMGKGPVEVYAVLEDEVLYLDLTFMTSEKRIVSESGDIRIDLFKQPQNTPVDIWEAVKNISWHGNEQSAPLAHISGIIMKRALPPSSEYPETEYPIIPFFSTADLMMRDKKDMEVITTVNTDHILLSLDIPLTAQQKIYVDRIELVLHIPQVENESFNYKALVTLHKSLVAYCEREGEILRLDLTSWESAERVLPPSGNIRIDFVRQAKNIPGAIWENVENITWHGNAESAPLAHVSGIIIKHNNPPTTDYPTTDYPGLGEQSHAQVKSEIPHLMNNTIPRSSIPRNNPVSRLSGAPEKPPKRYYYMNDGKRNITSLRSQQEGICATYTYGTFGQKLEETGKIAKTNPFRYSSEYHDDDLGLIYYNYRHYNPKDGRWLTPDPKQEEGGINLYAFCTNNPTSRIDNLGLDSAMTGASQTGFSAHWGNIVREGLPWATVCYKYYKKADYMGYISMVQIWEELADATKLNFEERDKWVRNYTPSPEPGTHFYIPNTFVIYTTLASTEITLLPPSFECDNMPYHPLKTAKEEKISEIKARFTKNGIKIIEHLEKEDRQLFLDSWKTEGIFGIAFAGHGMDNGNGAWKGGGFCTTNNRFDFPVFPYDIRQDYKLAFIAAFCCGAKEVGWGNKGDGALLSDAGSYIGYWGQFTSEDDSGGGLFYHLGKNISTFFDSFLKSLDNPHMPWGH